MLARLEITEAELPVYVGSLSAILAFVEQLVGRADRRMSSRWRTRSRARCSRSVRTRVTESTGARPTRPMQPAVEAGLYLVPKVIE